MDDLPNAALLGLTVAVVASLAFTAVLTAGLGEGEHLKQTRPCGLD
jgi:hypothetical protein